MTTKAMENELQLTVVLVESQGALNIGSVCRSMLNFGFTDLRLVNPQIDHLSADARLMAVKAAPVLENAQVFTSLQDALAGCVLSFATTCRFGRYRENMLHPDIAALRLLPAAQGGKVALVFGREDCGLLNAELDLCQHFITIPTDEKLPSMNLAQAVTVCLYEINKIKNKSIVQAGKNKQLASNDMLESMYQHMRRSLLAIDYLDPQNPDHILRTFRRILGRSDLDERDVRIFRGLFNQIDIYSGHKFTRKQLSSGDE